MMVGHNSVYDEMGEGYFDRRRFFGSCLRSMLTLFQIITLDNWTLIVRPIVEGPQPYMLYFFIPMIFVGTFGLLNLLIAVLVENVITQARQNEEDTERLVKDEQRRIYDCLSALFTKIDVDGSGDVSVGELKRYLSGTQAVEIIKDSMLEISEIRELAEITSMLVADEMKRQQEEFMAAFKASEMNTISTVMKHVKR